MDQKEGKGIIAVPSQWLAKWSEQVSRSPTRISLISLEYGGKGVGTNNIRNLRSDRKDKGKQS